MQTATDTSLARALQFFNEGQLADAAQICMQVLSTDLSNASARFLLGMVELGDGDTQSAIRHLSVASRNNPQNALFHFYHGNALQAASQETQALGAYRRAILTEPGHAPSHYNMGVCLARLGAYKEATIAYRSALTLDPDDVATHYNLGNALSAAGDYAAAVVAYRDAVDRKPAWPEALMNLGSALHKLQRVEEAESAFYRALSLKPESPEVFYNLGVLFIETGRLDQAVSTLSRTIDLMPEHKDAMWNLALSKLGTGDLEGGFELYESRWARGVAGLDCIQDHLSIPQWDGDDLTGLSLLVAAEQGIGDEIMYASCIPDAIELAHHVVIECAPKLVPVFQRAFPDATVRPAVTWLDDEGLRRHSYTWLDALPQAQRPDVYIAAGSLPGFVRPDLASFRRSGKLFKPDGRTVAGWRRRLAGIDGNRKFGLCWRSGLKAANRDWLYASLMDFHALGSLEGVTFIDLQYDESGAERAEFEAATGIKLHHFDDLDMKDDLDRTSGLIAALDGVISAPTAVAQIAGAVNVPCWRVIIGSDWSCLGQERSPWFPSVKQFTMARDSDRAEELARLVEDVRTHFSKS